MQSEEPRFSQRLNYINQYNTEYKGKNEIDQLTEYPSCPWTKENIPDLKNSLELSPVSKFVESGRHRDNTEELVNRTMFDKILQQNQLVFTEGPSVVLGQGKESGDIPQATRLSGPPSKGKTKWCKNSSEIKKIYDTDIQSVLSTEEVVEHFAQRPVLALEYDDVYVSSKFASKREGPFLET